jgi:hypothetical protein
MTKWEYLKTWTYDPGTITNKWRICILPQDKIDQKSLIKEFPALKLEIEKDHPNLLNVYPPKNEPGLYYQIVEFLCSEGWEPFAVENNTLHYRRKISD